MYKTSENADILGFIKVRDYNKYMREFQVIGR